MKKIISPQEQTFWYLKRDNSLPLQTDQEADVVIVGGGMAGITTAQAFAQKGKKVILFEAYYCGAGASGKSSGFIEPNCEISLSEFVSRYGDEGGKIIWDAIRDYGVEHIRNNIKQYQIDCDYTEQDSIDVASSLKDVDDIKKEVENLAKYGYETRFIDKKDIPGIVGSEKYHGGVLYTNSFGISAYKYCQAMKDILIRSGVQIYEETPVLEVQEHKVRTLHATVKTKYVIICADRFIPTLGKLKKEIYHVQNFLLASETLSADVIHKIFPQTRVMVCDTELIYNFYRMTEDRLLLGGGSLWNFYNKNSSCYSDFVYKKLTRYIKSIFPDITIQFEQMWPGLIGVSKDIAPLLGRDKDSPFIYYVAATTGLPLGAMLGNYCVAHIVDGADWLKDYFSPYRKFYIQGALQSILGTKATFALSHWLMHMNARHV